MLVVVFVIANIGFPVYLHYCGGELEKVSAFVKEKNCCGTEEDEDDGCCKNEKSHVSFKSEFDVIVKSDFDYHPLLLQLFFNPMNSYSFVVTCLNNISSHALQAIPWPPGYWGITIVKATVFRI